MFTLRLSRSILVGRALVRVRDLVCVADGRGAGAHAC
jgi:hypothetical protein